MDDNKYFKLIWRFNSIVIMAAGLAALAGMVMAGIIILIELAGKNEYRDLVQVDTRGSEETQFELGYLNSTEHSPYVMVPLNSSEGYESSYSSGKSWVAHNYIFINAETNEQRWLFNTNEYYIADYHLLNIEGEEGGDGSKNPKAQAILYEVIKKDTNGDEMLTHDDAMTLSLSLPNGKNYQEIVQDLDVFIGHSFDGKDSLVIVYQRNKIGYSANIRISDFTLLNESRLPEVGS